MTRKVSRMEVKYKYSYADGKRMSKKLFDRLMNDHTMYFIDGVIYDKKHHVVAFRKEKG